MLIVEDDARQRESIRDLLGQADVQITEAETAQQALQALATTTFDCMVLDFNLPDSTAMSCWREWRSRRGSRFRRSSSTPGAR